MSRRVTSTEERRHAHSGTEPGGAIRRHLPLEAFGSCDGLWRAHLRDKWVSITGPARPTRLYVGTAFCSQWWLTSGRGVVPGSPTPGVAAIYHRLRVDNFSLQAVTFLDP